MRASRTSSTHRITRASLYTLTVTHKDQVNAELLAFFKERAESPAREKVSV
jgi:hypothetical protein